jgi:hypothetical protein
MRDTREILQNIENIYGSNNSLKLLKDFERVLDELDLYVYENWIDGELLEGPKESRYFISCKFMWPEKKMPNPKGGMRLLDYGCRVFFEQDEMAEVRKIKTPDDIRPGTKQGKIDHKSVWIVEIRMPKKLMFDVDKGYRKLTKNKVESPMAGVITAVPPSQQSQAEPVEGGTQ